MLKNKEKRDTALLIFMAVITIAFLLYVFVPRGEKEKKPATKDEQTTVVKKEEPIKESPQTDTSNDTPTDEPAPEQTEDFSRRLNPLIETELNAVYQTILLSDTPFENYRTETLDAVLSSTDSVIIDKLSKFSFQDLDEITTMTFPEGYNDTLKFNLYLSLFLTKLQTESMAAKLHTLPESELEKSIRFGCYGLIGGEIREDYQLLPVLFYFDVLVKRLDAFPVGDASLFFKQKLAALRDLGAAKHLVRLRELLRFTVTPTRFRVQWEEYDAIGSNDKKIYPGLTLNVLEFLGRQYLVFPDPAVGARNQWLHDLRDADSGEIELVKLNVMSEDPANPRHMTKLFYSPISSKFFVLLKPFETVRSPGFLQTIVRKRITEYHDNFTIIDFSRADTGPKILKAQLKQFGNYLKHIK